MISFQKVLALLLQTQILLGSAAAAPVVQTSDVDKRTPVEVRTADYCPPSSSSSDSNDHANTYPTDDQIYTTMSDGWRSHNVQNYVFWAELYLGDRSENARRFAHGLQGGGIVVNDVVPTDYFCVNGRSRGWWVNFADRISIIYARMIPPRHNIYLVTNAYNGLQTLETTFQRVEAPTLINNGFEYITVVDGQDFSKTRQVKLIDLINNGAKTKRDLSTNETEVFHGIARRDARHVPVRLNWPGYGDDPNGPCSKKDLTSGYSSGWCGVHVSESLKSGFLGEFLGYDVSAVVKDDNGEPVGHMNAGLGSKVKVSITGALPWTFDITTPSEQWAPLKLAYGDWSASTDYGGQCAVGKWDNFKRELDCGFPCK